MVDRRDDVFAVGRLDRAPPADGETFHELLSHPHARVKHIVSSSSPDTAAYDQDEDEFVVVLRGAATMEIDGEIVALTAGDHLWLRAHTRHRVLRTETGTEWLAVYLNGDASASA